MSGTARMPPKVPRPEPAPIVAGVVTEVAGDFWERCAASTPLIAAAGDGRYVVTFLWRDPDAAEVLLFVNRITDERNLSASLMERVAGTDVWQLSYEMDGDWRAAYGFVPRRPGQPWPWTDGDQASIRAALDRALPDPRNPSTSRNRAGTALSVVALPTAPVQRWLERRPGVPAGELAPLAVPGGRRVWLYTPPGRHDATLPVVVVLDGDVWTSTQDLPATFDNLLSEGLVRPSLLAFVDSSDRAVRWRDLDELGGMSDWIVDDLLPGIPGASRDPADLVVAGQSLGGLTALRTALEHPGRVGGVLAQSASLWRADPDALLASGDASGLRAYIEVGRQEWVLRRPNVDFAVRLAAAGAEVRLVEYDGGHDYACWRGGIADGLRMLLSPAR